MAGNNGFWTRSAPYLLSVLRIIAAFLFMCHGADKLFNLPEGPFTLRGRAWLALGTVPGQARLAGR